MAAVKLTSFDKRSNRESGTSRDSSLGAKVDKYLTDIKELPPALQKEKVERKEDSQVQRQEQEGLRGKHEMVAQDQDIKDSQKSAAPESVPGKEQLAVAEEEEVKKYKLPLSSKDIILGLINLISVILLVIILMRFPSKAQELKNLRIESQRNESGISFEFSEIDAYKVKAARLNDLFLDESGVVDFVNEVEKLKVEGSAFNKITFASQKVVKDKTGNYGIPVIIELKGSWEAIGNAMEAVDKLPFLFRPVNIVADQTEEGIIFKYGGFLYVNDRLGKD